ncbi:hypothetical protein [Riemerella anatipestifer]|uniref:hypothetical protein n=1 Tax=Riemerella anatipestifer TaxID=34085 RepID=UPI00129E6685|nr:hypothetical protein [Riemerella anatipestifer]MRM83388.1 hypothetical protein [Riemerella anatipestifer]
MQKQTFIEAIEAIENQDKYDNEVAEALNKAFPDNFKTNLKPNNLFLYKALVMVLNEAMNDVKVKYGMTHIEWYVWATSLGKHKAHFMKKYPIGVKIKNAAELYDFLKNNKQ